MIDDESSLEDLARAVATAEDPSAAAEDLLHAIGVAAAENSARDRASRSGFSIWGLLLALVSAAGMTTAIALLYRGMAVIMETEGGFVATGGPYVIAHPAPGWVWIMPVSIFGLFIFGGINLAAASRNWGISLTILAWMGLFIALGWNFLRLGFSPPVGLQGAWAWILCGVVFWLMGFAPGLMVLNAFRSGWKRLLSRQTPDAVRMWTPPSAKDTTAVYLVAQALGVAAGIAGAIALFAAITA